MTEVDHDNVRPALDWFLSFLGTEEWTALKASMEAKLQESLPIHPSRKMAELNPPVSTAFDTIHWYLYLAENFLTSAAKYEPIQGARIMPVLARLGSNLDLLTQVDGAVDKAKKLVRDKPEFADSTLFEFLIAILWKRNGWPAVSFVPESASTKTPDLVAESRNSRWAIECKRLSKKSGYSTREREKWLRLWRPLSRLLVNRRYAVVLDIVFHVELATLPDEFVVDELNGKLPFVETYANHVISNDIWDVKIRPVNLERAAEHLSQNYVKCPSDQMIELIGGRRDPNRGFTCVYNGRTATMGTGHVFDRFVDSMDFAAGAFWNCDAVRSIEKKARDIRRHLSGAVRQLPEGLPSVVHVGLETLDGVAVEAERYQRIFNTVRKFDVNGKPLRWVFCHLFQSYAPPEQAWVMDETVYYFATSTVLDQRPLENFAAVVPESEVSDSGVHWMRDPP